MIFRRAAIEKLSSPEQLDLMIDLSRSGNFRSLASGFLAAVKSRTSFLLSKSIHKTKYQRTRTPTVLQMEAVECGAACLAMILGYYGRIASLEELRVACGVTRNGTNALNLMRAGKAYGLESRGFKKKVESLKSMELPFVVFWNFNHYLVVEGWSEDGVFLNDPGCGPRKVTHEEFDESYTGVVLTFKPGEGFEKGGRRKTALESVRDRISGHKTFLMLAALISVLLVLPGLALPLLSRLLVDKYLVGGDPAWLNIVIIGLALTAAARVGLTWLQEYLLLRLEIGLSVSTTTGFMRHIIKLPMEFFRQRFGGEIGSRVGFNDEIASAIARGLASTAVDIIMVVFLGIAMVIISPLLAAVCFCATAINLFALKAMNRSIVDGNRRLQQEAGKAMAVAMGGIEGIETMRATGGESEFFEKWAGHHAKIILAKQGVEARNQLFLLVPSLMTGLTDTAVLGLGGFYVIKGGMTLGSVVAFQALLAAFSGPVRQLAALTNVLQDLQGKIERLEDVLHAGTDSFAEKAPGEDGSESQTLSGALEIKNLTFGYSRRDPPLIENLDVTLRPGMRLAVVGPSGCGKSTLAQLVCRLFKPRDGQILFDGVPLDEVDRNAFSASVSFVDQTISLFEGTVRDNITLWDKTISGRDVERACKDALIHDDIMARNGAYDSVVHESGLNFSGGQRQRLEIARALVRNPRIIILDESTSALDAISEERIMENLRARGCACIIIAHRLSTIRDADEIIVLDKGKPVQRGAHHDLIKDESGLYAQLVNA